MIHLSDFIVEKLKETNNIGKIVESANTGRKRLEDYDKLAVKLSDGSDYVIDMVKLIEEQERAKAALVHIQPFFRGLVGMLKFIYTFRVDTQATDGTCIYVNPYFTDKLDFEQKVFVLAHEIMHNVLNHMRRGIHDDRDLSNIAADYECNVTLDELDVVSEETMRKTKAYFDKKYTDWGYEKIYADVVSNPPPKPPKPPVGPTGGGDGGGGHGPGRDGEPEKHSPDFKKGWSDAIADYKAGKIKI